jgi:uncharacterized protein involved in exopolysaccharide biosynthesis
MTGTDVFVGQVMGKVEPQYESWSPEHRQQAIEQFRQDIAVVPQAEHLFVVSYKAPSVEYGVAVLRAVLDLFTVTVQDLEASQLGNAQKALQSQLETARQDMNAAVGQAESYRASHRLDDRTALTDPNYNILVAQARTKTDQYLTVLFQLDEAQASRQAVGSVQASIFHVVDPPAPVPQRISRTTPAIRYAGATFAGVAIVEALLIYVVARRDPSIRSLHDVRTQVGLKTLGSTPPLLHTR